LLVATFVYSRASLPGRTIPNNAPMQTLLWLPLDIDAAAVPVAWRDQAPPG
jgi:hypothetical protein